MGTFSPVTPRDPRQYGGKNLNKLEQTRTPSTFLNGTHTTESHPSESPRTSNINSIDRSRKLVYLPKGLLCETENRSRKTSRRCRSTVPVRGLGGGTAQHSLPHFFTPSPPFYQLDPPSSFFPKVKIRILVPYDVKTTWM